ncbi:MAG: multidrug efflux RND transporter permease subunit [Alphaproteobacteria bacterium]|nr:multidrug efflux RND transporter permease subunit [Alphaproteobacteria bacterium]
MSFTDIFIQRPVLATVVSLIILLVGLQAAFSLQVRQFPELTNTTITITTAYPGANAELIKGFITTPIEQAVASTEGIDTMVSSSRQNVSTVTLNLRLNADPDRAVADVLSKVNQVGDILPREANDPVVVKETGQGFALMYLSFNSDTMTAPQITDYITRVIQPKLQTLEGVGNAQILGGQTFAMRIWLDPKRMAARGVTASDINNALVQNNFTSAAGEIKGDFVQTSINVNTDIDNAQDFGDLVIRAQDNTLVRIKDVADIELGPQSAESSSLFDGLKAVFIGVYGTPTSNPLNVIDNVRAAMPEIQAALPVGLKATIAYDSTKFIRSSIEEVIKTLAEAAIIVIIVIFLFLGNIRSTLIPVVTIPLSLIGVMVCLLLLGYSINLLTLLAMVLAIGLVVDDAIVVVENIYRHIEEGKTPYDAALIGAREITLPVIGMTLTLAAVFAPIGFTTGLTGALFKEFAFTLAGAVVVSGIIALTLSPMMCAKFLRDSDNETGFAKFLNRFFDKLKNRYQRRLHKTLNFRAMTVVILLATMVLTVVLYLSTPQELAPEEDQGVLFTIVKTPDHTNLDYLEHTTLKLNDVFSTIPEKQNVFTINGSGGVTQAFAGILFAPWDERTRNSKQILQDLQPKLSGIPEASIFSFSPSALPSAGGGGPPMQFVVQTTGSFTELADVLNQLQMKASESGMFIFTDSDLKFTTPQIEVTIDRDKANSLGITMQDIGTSLSTLLGGNYVNRFSLAGRSYQVIPQVPRDYRLSSDWLNEYRIRTASGELVPLSNIVSLSESVQPNALTTFQQLNSATLQGVPFPGRTLGDALAFLETTAKEIFPAGYSYDFQGESRQFKQESGTLLVIFAFALIIIFLVLAAQYESFRDPLIILISLPTAMFGALLPLNILSFTGMTSINIYTQIGLVTLIGLISKHGILMVDFANSLQLEKGYGRRQAIEEASAVRLRPILMTAVSMIVAMVPLLMATGAGAASRFSIGLVIASGMTIGTLFTLFVTPAMYTLIAKERNVKPKTVPTAGQAYQRSDPEDAF